jgi:hypothetical protein
MRWAKTSLRNSFFAWLGNDGTHASEDRIEKVRAAMLLALQQCGKPDSAVEIKISFAKDIEELWYQRPTLMHLISASRGESVARSSIAEITELFGVSRPGGSPRR